MITNDFIAALRRAPENLLLFVDSKGNVVHRGYHLTEIKAATFDAVDCGGQTNRWGETVFQLWIPANRDADYMTAGKFLRIFDRVSGIIPLAPATDARVEYGDETFFPSIYHVRSVTIKGDTTRVLLEPPRGTCKARDRRVQTRELESACC